jgi:putative DNA primase/helicase
LTEHNIRPSSLDAHYEETDLGNARRLVDTFGEDLHYVAQWGKWLAWTGTRWKLDVSGEVDRKAKLVTEQITGEGRYLLSKAATDASQIKAATDVIRFGLRSQSSRSLVDMVRVAATEPGIPVFVDGLDADPWSLSVANGTLDLRTGTLRPQRRQDLITKTSPVEYSCEATCPRFEEFLERALPDPEVKSFVQRAVGYSLTGVTTEHVLFIAHGSGANGKSTLMEVLLDMFGDHGAPAAPRLLVLEKHSEHPTAVADLHGRRLVVSQEVQEGHRLDEALVKQLTGGDTLKARQMRQDFWSFRPTHKLWLACNHKPAIRGTDFGLWRRIRLIPFEVAIPSEEQDRQLGEKLRAELPGILHWAVEGCLAWQREGLNAPKAVTVATDSYKLDSDLVGMFLDESCVTGISHQVRSADLFEAYLAWCVSNGIDRPLPMKALVQQLDERGYDRTKNRLGQALWIGLDILNHNELAAVA